jgi:hypothetical protein
MAVFPRLDFEPVVQVDDLTRLDAGKSLVTPDETSITGVEIQPEGSADFIDVSQDRYLDWVYATAGSKTVTVRVSQGATQTTKTFTLTTVTEATDALWSTDVNLKEVEPTILGHVPDGRDSFKNIHRAAKRKVIDDLDRRGFFSTEEDYKRLNDANFTVTEDLREWSTYLALSLIFCADSNKPDDDAAVKARAYAAKAAKCGDRAILRMDQDEDGDTDEGEGLQTNNITVVRR